MYCWINCSAGLPAVGKCPEIFVEPNVVAGYCVGSRFGLVGGIKEVASGVAVVNLFSKGLEFLVTGELPSV